MFNNMNFRRIFFALILIAFMSAAVSGNGLAATINIYRFIDNNGDNTYNNDESLYTDQSTIFWKKSGATKASIAFHNFIYIFINICYRLPLKYFGGKNAENYKKK